MQSEIPSMERSEGREREKVGKMGGGVRSARDVRRCKKRRNKKYEWRIGMEMERLRR